MRARSLHLANLPVNLSHNFQNEPFHVKKEYLGKTG